MPVFQGTMRLEEDPDATLQSLLTLDEDRLSLAASGQELGEWNVAELTISQDGNDVRIEVDDQAVVFTTNYADRLTEAVTASYPTQQEGRRGRRGRKKVKAQKARPENGQTESVPASKAKAAKQPREPRFRFSDFSLETRVVAGVALVALLMFVFLPTLLMTVMALVGTVGILLAITAIMEPTVAARLPTDWPPQRILIAGLTLMVIGLMVGIIR